MQTAKTLIGLGGCPGWSKSSLGAHAILLVLSWGGLFYKLKFDFHAMHNNIVVVFFCFFLLFLLFFLAYPALFEPRHDRTNKMTVCSAKTQVSLGMHPGWSESSLCAQWVAKDRRFLQADSEDWSDWADAQADLSLRWAHTVTLLVLSCRGSFQTGLYLEFATSFLIYMFYLIKSKRPFYNCCYLRLHSQTCYSVWCHMVLIRF